MKTSSALASENLKLISQNQKLIEEIAELKKQKWIIEKANRRYATIAETAQNEAEEKIRKSQESEKKALEIGYKSQEKIQQLKAFLYWASRKWWGIELHEDSRWNFLLTEQPRLSLQTKYTSMNDMIVHSFRIDN